jgi:hypothetical protein
MLQLDNAEMRYRPYPLAVIRPALAPAHYDELSAAFPAVETFGRIPKYDWKLSLSEKFNPDVYHRFIATNRPWNRFHAYVKSDAFIREVAGFLKSRNVDLELDDHWQPTGKRLARAISSIARGRFPSDPGRLSTRFEFSVLKADGGEVAPHTDSTSKIITLVLSMIRDGEWDPSFGGGLDINEAIDDEYAFNWKNRGVPWDKIRLVDTVPFVPNQCMIFVKTFNSLHSVRKMIETGSKAYRKSVTIVIERD